MSPDPARKPLTGPVVGVLLALVVIALLFNLYSDGSAGSLYVAIFVALVVLAPLLLVNLILTAVYLRRKVAGVTYAWMWLPIFSLYFVALIADAIYSQHKQNEAAKHPSIQEVHINLSGRDLWLDPDVASSARLAADKPEEFLPLTRYAGGSDSLSAYRVARLAPDFNSLRVFTGPPLTDNALTLPVQPSPHFPDTAAILPLLHYDASESGIIRYAYYHYRDHVEVAATLLLAGSSRMDLQGSALPVLDVHLVNLGRLPLARLEIDGETMDIGEHAVMPEKAGDCDYSQRNRSATTLLGGKPRLQLRWQLAQADPAWHEASVTVPAFAGARPPGQQWENAVELYFQEDGSVVAEPSQLYHQGDEVSLRLLASPPPLLRQPACGRVEGRFQESVKLLRQ